VDVESGDAGGDHLVSKPVEALFGILIVDADPALDRDWPVRCLAHGPDAVCDKVGLGHEAGAEAA
jgi:hypothetical protein